MTDCPIRCGEANTPIRKIVTMRLPSGTYVPIVTPFNEQRELDNKCFDQLIDKLLDADVEAIVVLGTTGESPTVTPEEFLTLINRTVTRVGSNAAVVAGVGSNDTKSSIQQARVAVELGVDGLLVVCPYYSNPGQRGLYEHFSTIAKEIPVPQLIYNIAGRSGVNIETETVIALAALPNIAGVKESSGNIQQVSDVLHQVPDDFLVLCGCDNLNFAALCHGGHGVISSIANLIPGRVKAMVDAARGNDTDIARQIHFELHDLVSACAIVSNPIPVKTALALMGEMQEVFRPPLCVMDSIERSRWSSVLGQYGLLDQGFHQRQPGSAGTGISA